MSDKSKPNAEFAAIENQARAIDNDAQAAIEGPKPAGAVVEVIDPAEAWAEIPAAVGGILGMAMPELRAVYTPAACKEWGRAMHRLAVKRQWAADGLPPEVGVIMASAGLLVPTVLAVKMRKDSAKRAAAA